MQDYGFERIGKRLFAEHLVGGNFGNMSVRDGKKGFFVKRTGTYLDDPEIPCLCPSAGRSQKTHRVNTVSISRSTKRRHTGRSCTPIPRMRSLPHL